LLTKNFPWLFREKNISLIRFGHDFFCLRNYRSEGSFKNVWEYNLKRTNNTELLDYYRKLTSMIGSLLKAASFSQLKTRLVQFTMEFFNQEEWDPEHRQVFERCIRLCDSLGETAEALPGIELSNPYAIFLLCLDRQEYVRQSRGSGIQVYPYRVSAGIYPASHFIFGLSAGDTNVRMERFTYLRSDQKTAAGLEDRDMTFPFLDVYGSSGEQVYCSYGRETQSGVKLPPGYFLDSLSRQSDPEWPLRREREYWAERISDLPPKLFPVLKKGLGFYHDTGWKKTGPDLSVEGSENADIALLARNALVDGEGYVHVSPSSLERFNSCPFSWLLSRVCGLEEEAVPDEFSDPAITGTLYHLVMRDLYETLKERSGMLESAQLDRYEALLKETFRATFSDWERFKPVFPEPLWREVRETILQDTLACLEAEIEEFDGYGIFSTEMKLAWKDSVKNVEYSGKVDRILSHNDSFYLTDYKKTLHFRQRQLQIPEDGGPPASSQIPFYLFLMEKNGYSAEGAGYFSFSDGKSIPVYAAQTDRKAWFYPETLKPLLERVEKDTQRLIDAVNRGSFPAVPSEAACRYCGLERLCRKKFSVR
ncbi:MAG: PD-(D/E)XK nuclease family protein, partial [Spirochaetales bacterium]